MALKDFSMNDQLQLAFDFVQFTGKNVFLTGKAGTGKTTFLHQLKSNSHKRMIVVAPTGVAAINAGGVTIHSFFQLPFGPFVPSEKVPAANLQRFNRDKISIIRSLDLLVIDEISMVRADLLDGIDSVLRRYKNRNLPFGGVQLLLIGDLQQLTPVAKEEEWRLLSSYYESVYFFSSLALKKTDYVTVELTYIFRQQDEKFIGILNKIRENKFDAETLAALHERYVPGFSGKDGDGYIHLTTHNAQAHDLNRAKLGLLTSRVHSFKAHIEGEFPEHSFPADLELHLKIGAQVMFVKNDSSREKLFYNGKIGIVTAIDEETVQVRCATDKEDIVVGRTDWANTKYFIDEQSKEIKESIIGSFNQIPLKLAWAITIHKSQGLTFEKVVVDANAAFTHGQVYVALSRCKTLEGIVLSTPIANQSMSSDQKVTQFSLEFRQNLPDKILLDRSKFEFERQLILELFDFKNLFRGSLYNLKLIEDHQESVHPILKDSLQAINTIVKQELCIVSEKFQVQLIELLTAQSDLKENHALQVRIKQASSYFTERLELNLVTKFKNIDIDIDNKTVKKSLEEAFAKFVQEANLRHACLLGSLNGFSAQGYMECRAKASIMIEAKSKIKSTATIGVTSAENAQLFKLLKNWRNQKASDLNSDAYLILQQKTLIELCSKLPRSVAALKTIKGLGVKKIAQFGNEIIAIISSYLGDSAVEEESAAEVAHEQKIKVDTKLISYELFQSGKSIEEVASDRDLSTSTIEGHLAHYLELGMIDIAKLVSKEKISTIRNWVVTNKSMSLSLAKAGLGELVSYSELRFVLKHLKYQMSFND